MSVDNVLCFNDLNIKKRKVKEKRKVFGEKLFKEGIGRG